MKSIVLVLPALFALAACGGGTQGADTTTEQAEAAGNVVGNSSVGPAPSASSSAAATASPSATAIPAAIQGRWGLVPADCTSTRGDAKGLLTVTADKLEFYESVGTLKTIAEAGPSRIRASFGFEGEGMSWDRDVVLDVQDDGATLIRREYGEDAAPGPFRYTKCNQGSMP